MINAAAKTREFRKAEKGFIMGYRNAEDEALVVDEYGADIEMHCEELNHSPCGPEWGYNGSGPAQLAYGLARVLLTKEEALFVHQPLKVKLISKLQYDFWNLEITALNSLCTEILATRVKE